MKSLNDYIIERSNNTTYAFKLKLAVEPSNELIDTLENAFNAYGLKSLSRPKRLPIQDNILDFPSAGPIAAYLMDLVVSYPATTEQLCALVGERTTLPLSQIVIRTVGEAANVVPVADALELDGSTSKQYTDSILKDLTTKEPK